MKRFAQETRDRLAPISARVIRQGREKLNLSVEEFAERSKLSPARIECLEGGQESPYINELEGLACALEVPLLSLIEKLLPRRELSAPGETP